MMPRQFDAGRRQGAATLQKSSPGWLIFWGRYERRFWAFPRFRADPGTIITGATLGELNAGMRAVELAAPPDVLPPLPPPDSPA